MPSVPAIQSRKPKSSANAEDESAESKAQALISFALLDALRRASTFDNAPDRCPRRGCKNAGECQMRLNADGAYDCGAGLPWTTIRKAMFATSFLHPEPMRLPPDLVEPELRGE